MSKKPIIIVTGPDSGGFAAWFFTALNIRWAGGQPVRITPKKYKDECDTYADFSLSPYANFDGVIIGGGSHVHPDNRQLEPTQTQQRSLLLHVKECLLYPMELLSRLSFNRFDKERDTMEQVFIELATERNAPVLGICRGHQLLNAFFGGTLYKSTLQLLQSSPRIRSVFPRKKVLYVKEDTLIARIAGGDPIKVNAIHSQAVAKPAECMEVTAKEKAGLNQVVESKKGDKVLGVQWHPEYLFYMPEQRRIFRWLVREAQ